MIESKKLRELEAACAKLPWNVEHDWTLELRDADGNLLGKFMAGAAPGKPVVPLLLYLVNHTDDILAALERVENDRAWDAAFDAEVEAKQAAERRVAELEAENADAVRRAERAEEKLSVAMAALRSIAYDDNGAQDADVRIAFTAVQNIEEMDRATLDPRGGE